MRIRYNVSLKFCLLELLVFNEVAILNIGTVHNVAQALIDYLHLVRVRITITWCNTQHITDNKSNNNEINMIVSIYNCFFFFLNKMCHVFFAM